MSGENKEFFHDVIGVNAPPAPEKTWRDISRALSKMSTASNPEEFSRAFTQFTGKESPLSGGTVPRSVVRMSPGHKK